jgi:hypothetical protein
MRNLVLLIVSFLFVIQVQGQELKCQISVSAPQVDQSNRKIFQTLQSSLYEYMNNRKWTSYNYKIEERIECSMVITINQMISSDEFSGKITIAYSRPVYKSSYNSPVLKMEDQDVRFKYVEFQTLEYNEGASNSNLMNLMAYYAYVIIGMDFDSFARFGGTPFYEKAQDIVSMAQNAEEGGWKAFESQKNRYWLVENLLNPKYTAIREAMYTYHRLGMDKMSDNIEQGRISIMESVEQLQMAYRERPNLYLMQLVMNSKSDELKNIFSQASPMDKTRAVNILTEIDPANASKYQKIMSGN